MSLKNYLLLGSIALIMISCENDSINDLIDNSAIPIVSYTTDVKPIITNNCLSCHGNPPVNGAPISLTTYDQVRDAIVSHGLLDRISRDFGETGLMPNGGPRLPQHTIDIITQWQSDGFQP